MHVITVCTDASHRFERGVDPQLQFKAIERATALIVEICGGEVGEIIDVTSEQHLPKAANIKLTRNKLDRLVGHFIEDELVTDILTRLGCKVTVSANTWDVVAPSWRFDMQIEEDLVEEVARVYGYNSIPDVPLRADLTMTNHKEANLPLKRIKAMLVDRGYQEAITYSFVDPKVQALLHPQQDALLLPNPISVDMSAMRLSLLTGLLERLSIIKIVNKIEFVYLRQVCALFLIIKQNMEFAKNLCWQGSLQVTDLKNIGH